MAYHKNTEIKNKMRAKNNSLFWQSFKHNSGNSGVKEKSVIKNFINIGIK